MLGLKKRVTPRFYQKGKKGQVVYADVPKQTPTSYHFRNKENH